VFEKLCLKASGMLPNQHPALGELVAIEGSLITATHNGVVRLSLRAEKNKSDYLNVKSGEVMIAGTHNNNIILSNVTDLDKIKATWCMLFEQCTSSYFLTWGWIEAWLKGLPSDCKVYFVETKQDEKTVLAFFVGTRILLRSGCFKIRQICLNVSGHDEYDNIWMEYNGFLYGDGYKNYDLMKILKTIPISWDEVYLPGLDQTIFPGKGITSLASPFRYIEDELTVSPYVDLKKVRQAGGNYLSLPSGNSRSQIRRSFRILGKIGSVELEVANSLERAFEIYQEMTDLHQETWQARGEPGAFSSRLFCRFHERLINNRFDKGEIQLLRIHVTGRTIGCLYSFLWRGLIYFYQSGFNYRLGKKVQPGLISHVMAVEYNASQGHDVYDFLAGDARYKRTLCTDYNQMTWGRIQRSSWKLRLEKQLRSQFQRFRGNQDEG